MTAGSVTEDTSFSPPSETETLVLEDDQDEEEEEEEDNDDDFDPGAAAPSTKLTLKTKKHRKSSIMVGGGNGAPPSATKRRRRRSSARFLRLSPDEEVEDGDEDCGTVGKSATSLDSLGDLYQKAIRMNAENRINAANSWNLNLIDHLDRFVAPELRSTNMASTMDDTLSAATGVNFTKASCTLDASVKIYSYRVDDVHLTSYKVLANLNRTDSNKDDKRNKTNKESPDGDIQENGTKSQRTGTKSAGGAVETLEHNLSNINIHKLDAAFDIDPLFHKMSKTFDEGGAKGLLLANLGVSSKGGAGGCKIVFDSSLDADIAAEDEKQAEEYDTSKKTEQTSVDVTSLVAKIDSMLATGCGYSAETIQDMPLVPQLASLRIKFEELEQGGFVDHSVVSTKRYASSRQEEEEADRSIHIEAIERSRASQADLGRSLLAQDRSDTTDRDSLGIGKNDYEPDDFGGGGGDFDDGDDTEFGGFHDGDHRFSSESFRAVPSLDDEGLASRTETQAQKQLPQPAISQATILLDAIASGDISTSQWGNSYEFFNSQALANLSSGNMWAGADHWKKMSKPRKAGILKDTEASSKSDVKKKKSRKAKPSSALDGTALVDITNPIHNLKDLMKKPPAVKRGTSLSKLQWTKAMQTKYSNVDNLLPIDAGLGIKELTTLFLRPNINLAEKADEYPNKAASIPKSVGFGGVETWGSNDNGFSDNEDDGGFDFGGGNDGEDAEDFVPVLEGVRKVEKIKVGYATVAKKVDVKRLKLDLWEELERTFQQRGEMEEMVDFETDPLEIEVMSERARPADVSRDEQNTNYEPVSFQDTVRDMQATQSQVDVTLPFYFICVLHLCNEKGLTLESRGLDDFIIRSS
ncbi:condensin complex subunit 2 [Nitzschia inconspicua]|uniref:Condensin complex subunit 2 n=1 Tax=Nitzschia inconspicua TaxID=303405 RepID=A0A9K3KUC3_9STRA|nr:condensin complex subunit 2 [Nitzschia inconspicua]